MLAFRISSIDALQTAVVFSDSSSGELWVFSSQQSSEGFCAIKLAIPFSARNSR